MPKYKVLFQYRKLYRTVFGFAFSVLLAACGAASNENTTDTSNSGDTTDTSCTAPQILENDICVDPEESSYSISVTISGLDSGLDGVLVLSNNSDTLSIGANGTFTFANALLDGAAYSVAVDTQPNGRFCTITNVSGTVSAAVTNITVACEILSYTLGGSVSGLSGTIILDNGTETVSVTSNSNFTFATDFEYGSSYAVTVDTQPSSQLCTIANASGTVSSDVTNIAVSCWDTTVISSGDYHSCAIGSTGILSCWGYNGSSNGGQVA